MSIAFAFSYGLRCLGIGKNRSQSNARKTLVGAICGIGISLIPLVLVLVVSDGMISGITRRLIELDTGQIKLIKMRVKADENDGRHELALKQNIVDTFAQLSFFKNAWVERSGTGLIIGKDGRSGGTIRAIEKKFFVENDEAARLLKVYDGSSVIENDNEVLIGTKLAETLSLKVGDSCRILTMRTSDSGTSIPRLTTYTVKGIISCGYQELDALWVFISLESGLKVLHGSSSLTSVLVSTANPFDDKQFETFTSNLTKSLPEDFALYTWKTLNRAQYTSFETTKNLLLFIMFLILFVASINISSALIMLVLERHREIAILLSVGTDANTITLSFFIAGMLTSFFGLLLGLPIGILLAINVNSLLRIIEKLINYFILFGYKLFNTIHDRLEFHILDPNYYLETIPISIDIQKILFIIIITFVLSAIVSIIPSIKAGREKPLDIMRKV